MAGKIRVKVDFDLKMPVTTSRIMEIFESSRFAKMVDDIQCGERRAIYGAHSEDDEYPCIIGYFELLEVPGKAIVSKEEEGE